MTNELRYPTKILVHANNGKDIPVKIKWLNNRAFSIYINHGMVDVSLGMCFAQKDYFSKIQNFVNRKEKNISKLSLKSMLDWKNKTIFILGKGRKITQDLSLKDHPDSFFYPVGSDFTKYFDSVFHSYLEKRLVLLANQAKIGLKPGFKVKVGYYRAKYGSFNLGKFEFAFDRRLFAYAQEVSDSVLMHELSHVLVQSHNPNFYSTLFKQMPKETYYECRKIIERGQFADEPKHENHLY